MKYRNFILRAVNLVLILGVLWQYQNTALLRADAVAQRQKAIREVEAWNASVLQAQQEAEEEKQAGPKDGTYEGSAYGFGDLITVAVTWKDGKMTDISVLKADGEDKPYYRQAVSVLNEMLEALPSWRKVTQRSSTERTGVFGLFVFVMLVTGGPPSGRARRAGCRRAG